MRILLAHNSLYYPAHGGGDRSNRLLMEALAESGHECRVVARTGSAGPEGLKGLVRDLAARSLSPDSTAAGIVRFYYGGVEVHTAANHPNLRAYFSSQIDAFQPDVILASTDDPAQVLLEAALRAPPPVVYLARATLALPFGPDSAFPSQSKTEQLRRVDRLVGVSRYVADYVRRFSNIPAVHVPISLLDPGPWPELGRFDSEFVTLVNPCAVKGIVIFTSLADALPDVRFAAVPTWGTNQADLAQLRCRPNIELLEPVENIDRILERTRVLLVPSLWAEARSRIVVEAMLRGVPVLASDIGGIPEAKMGVPYLLPVRPIQSYRPELDEHMVPVAEVPPQDIRPWKQALARLISDPDHYRQIAVQSLEAALRYAYQLSVQPFEDLLWEAVRQPRAKALPAAAASPLQPAGLLESLSPERRALLALRLRKRSGPVGNPWFPTAEPDSVAGLRLFCFPHAGAGAAAFNTWREYVPETVALAPVRLPGRESRISEAAFRTMEPLIEALADAILPLLNKPFAFYGHSMGAAIAFELTRCLRKRKSAGPRCLLVSGARAPQFRLGHLPGPEPSEAELMEQLRRLEGVPAEILENREMMGLLMPALRADTALYRGYVYTPEPPLECPIHAFGGRDDPDVTKEHLEAWAAQTTAQFRLRMFPGGHFFFHTSLPAFIRLLTSALPLPGA
jgi:surfactin synthase thioesterase subunit/glycosyltransferase involved in cell wall biosynthesis